MTPRTEIESVLDRYLADGAEVVPDRVIDAALDDIEHTDQRRARRVPWRFPEMPSFMKFAVTGAAVIAAVLVGGMLLTRGSGPAIGGPPIVTPSPTAAPTTTPPAPSATSNCELTWLAQECRSAWRPFASERYGYELAYPPTWEATPATREWAFGVDRLGDINSPGSDHFLGRQGGGVLVTAFAVEVPPETDEEEWIASYYEGSEVEGVVCDSRFELEQITVDGRSGRIAVNDACFDAQAFVLVDGRIHVFAIWRASQSAVLEAFLSTVRFR